MFSFTFINSDFLIVIFDAKTLENINIDFLIMILNARAIDNNNIDFFNNDF